MEINKTCEIDKKSVFLETLKTGKFDKKSLLFSNPASIIKAYKYCEVEKALSKIEYFLKKGFFVAGFISYEAGYAFEETFKNLGAQFLKEYPLVWLGVYEKPKIIKAGDIQPQVRNDEGYIIENIRLDISKREYIEKIKRIKEYIRSGDTYQINLTQKIRFDFLGKPYSLYKTLRASQKVKYAAYIRIENADIMSFSPELFFRVKGGRITVRPMKGTIKRGVDEVEDRKLREKLYQSDKNRAENLMIVDLLRNDLSKICKTGSVKTKKLYEIEKYKTLYQMVSEIEGEILKKTTYLDIFKNIFPSGSVTGAPKIQSMQIITELEKSPRGVYTGAIGYISPKGESVFNVAIRTPVITGNSGVMGIGGGIVWDSQPIDEYKECLLKAKFLLGCCCGFHLLETMLYKDGKYFLLEQHLNRMKKSAEYFKFNYKANKIRRLMELNKKKLNVGKTYKVRLLVSKNGKIEVENHPINIGKNREMPVAALSALKINSKDEFLYHKTTNRKFYNDMYEKAKEKGYYDYIFLNERNEVTEGCINSIFIEKNGKLLTPPVKCGLLNGVMRQHILETNKNAVEKIIRANDLFDADSVYMCNSIRGMVKVRLKCQ